MGTLYDTDSTVQSYGLSLVEGEIPRTLLPQFRETILAAPVNAFHKQKLWVLLGAQGAQRDSLLSSWPLDATGVRAALGDSNAVAYLVTNGFPDSASFLAGRRLAESVDGMELETALWTNYLFALDIAWMCEAPAILTAIGQVTASDTLHLTGVEISTFGWHVLWRYIRLHEDDTLASRGLAWIKLRGTENAIEEGLGLSVRQFYDRMDSTLQKTWGIRLPVPRKDQKVLLFRNFYADPLPSASGS